MQQDALVLHLGKFRKKNAALLQGVPSVALLPMNGGLLRNGLFGSGWLPFLPKRKLGQ
jgi:hypothetical protein